MSVGLRGRGVDNRGCSKTDADAWEVGGQDVERVTGGKEICNEFVKGLEDSAGSLLE